MDDTTKEVLAQLSGAAVPLLQTGVNMHLENKRMEKRTEAKLRAAERRHERMQDMGVPDPVTRTSRPARPQSGQQSGGSANATDTPSTGGQEAVDALKDLQAEETCEMCLTLLQGLEQRPVDEQLRGVKEYGAFKRALEADGDVESLLAETDVLSTVIEEEIK